MGFWGDEHVDVTGSATAVVCAEETAATPPASMQTDNSIPIVLRAAL
jgi:hypothetical protein